MKKGIATALVAAVFTTTGAMAADLPMVTKAPPAPAPAATSPWDVAFGAGFASDYNFRGITQSAHNPSISGYFEPRYNINSNLQAYIGAAGNSIEFPNNDGVEVDLYGGIRPTFDKLALDFGIWYYYYPGGRTFTGAGPATTCTNLFFTPTGFCNSLKADLSFVEVYAKGTYTFNDNWAAGAQVYYDPDWLNSGAWGTYLNGNVKYTGATFANGIGWYASADVNHYWFGTTDAFYGTPAFPSGIQLPGYTGWDIGFGFTYKVFTLDLRYYDTDLSKSNCDVLTGDHTATFSPSNVSAINPSGLGSNWCGSAFIAKLSVDTALSALK